MVSSPIGELPKIGRAPVFLSTFAVFTALQVPTALSVNIGMFLSFRFLAAFVGSPCLALGSATFPDMWPAHQLGYGLGFWDAATIVGPMLGPVIGNVTAQEMGWRWTIWVLLCAAGLMLIILAVALPETNPDNILYRRARRLRKLTHNENLKSEAERQAKNADLKRVAWETLARPFILALREPIVLALDLYLALSYALFYVWTQSFPLVFEEIYGFSAAKEGYTFLGILVGTIVTLVAYCFYFMYYESRRLPSESSSDKPSDSLEKNSTGSEKSPRPEMRLIPAMFGALWIPICLFWFGWTSRSDIHWMCPLIASSTFAIADFCLFVSPTRPRLPLALSQVGER
jgi:DHA1 family multidrug resistance protein-like MFS transporter